MKIGILQTGLVPTELAPQTGEYPAFFERLLAGYGFEFESWSVVNNEFPDGPEAADGWLITGSRHGAYEDHDWIPPLEQLIRDIMEADRPLVGVCFGHQIIAQALGGKVEKFSGGWAVGPTTYSFGNEELKLHAWHQDQVVQKPEGAEIVAQNEFCANAFLLYPGKAYSVQPHPEYDDGFLNGLIAYRGKGVVPEGQLTAAKAAMNGTNDGYLLAAQFARFFKERRLA